MAPAKVRDYLVFSPHPVGRFEAAFCLALGYSQAGWWRLTDGVRTRDVEGEAVPGTASQRGR